MKKKIITIPGFGGGLANSPYSPLSEQSFQTAQNLDVFKFTHILEPVNKMVERAMDTVIATTKVSTFHFASNGTPYLFGNSGTNNQLRIFSSSFAPTFSISTVATSAVSTTAPSPFHDAATFDGRFHVAELAGYMLFWEGVLLSRVLLSGPTFASDPYSWSHGGTTGPIFVHEGLRKAFIAVDNKVYTLDSTTISGSADPILALTLDNKYVIRSFTNYGRFVLIGAQAKGDSTTSKVFVYDGSGLTVEDVWDIGDVGLQAIRNVNGVIHALVTKFTFGDLNNYTRIYLNSGSSFQLADELIMSSSVPASISGLEGSQLPYLISDTAVTVQGDILYWSYNGYYNQNNYTGLIGVTNGVYAFGKREVGQPRVLTLFATTATSMSNHHATKLQIIRNNIYLMYAGLEASTATYHFENQLDNYVSTTLTPGYKSSSGVYESVIFPLDGINGQNRGTIESIELQHRPMPSSCGFTMAVKHYGAYEVGGIPATDSYTDLTTAQGSGSSTGKTQSTDNSTYTIIKSPNSFKKATHASIKISYDETSTTNAPAIIWPSIKITTNVEENG